MQYWLPCEWPAWVRSWVGLQFYVDSWPAAGGFRMVVWAASLGEFAHDIWGCGPVALRSAEHELGLCTCQNL